MPQNYLPEDPYILDQPVSAYSPGNGNFNNPLETKGIKANRDKAVAFQLSGKQVYDLCNLLRRVAVNSQAYIEVMEAVTFERLLFEQARQQGF